MSSGSLLAGLRLAKGRLSSLALTSLDDLRAQEEVWFEQYGSRQDSWLRSRRALISAELAASMIDGMEFTGELPAARYGDDEKTDPSGHLPDLSDELLEPSAGEPTPVEAAEVEEAPVEEAPVEEAPVEEAPVEEVQEPVEAPPEELPDEPFDPIVESDEEVTIVAQTADVLAELEAAEAEGELSDESVAEESTSDDVVAEGTLVDDLDEVDIDDLDDPLDDDLAEDTLDDRALPEETVQDDPVPGSEEYDLEPDSEAPPEEIADSDSVFDIDEETRPSADEIFSGEVDDLDTGVDPVDAALFADNESTDVSDRLTRPEDRSNLVEDLGGTPILPTIKDRTAPPPVAAAAIQLTPDGARAVGARLAEEDEIVELPPSDDPELDNMAPSEGGFHFEAEEMEYVDDDHDHASHAPELTPDADYPAFHDGSHELSGDEVSEVAPVDPEAIKRLHDSAAEALDRGDLNAAAMAYSSLLEMDPTNLDAHLGRGRCYLDLGDYAAAMSDFQKAEDVDPEGPEPLVAMGELFFARKEYSRAIEFFDQAIELDSSHAMARCRRGISYYYKKSYRQAFLDLQKAYTLDPEIPNIRKYVQMAIKKLERSGEG